MEEERGGRKGSRGRSREGGREGGREGKESMVFVESMWEGSVALRNAWEEGRQGIGRDGEFQHHGYTCSEAERVPW